MGQETLSAKCDELVTLGRMEVQGAKFISKKLSHRVMSWLFCRVDSETKTTGC